ncbi:MAG: condensation domain-containing protein, partial [Nitrospirales bacterium]
IKDEFAWPVLKDLARELERAERIALPGITRTGRGERIPLSFAQQRLWFLAQMEGVSQAYHVPFGVRLGAGLDVGALKQALERVVRRHEALRTTFGFEQGEPWQRIGREEESVFRMVEHDLRQSEGRQEELERLIAEEAQEKFDLEGGPLIRGRLIRVEEDEHVLLVTMHHIVSDGWSMAIFLNELSALYGAYRRGEADPLPELKVQYADYAVWQRKWMGGEILGRQAEYWKEALAGAPELLEVPADRVRPAEQEFAGASVRVALDEKLTAGLKELSRKQGTTLYMTLLSGWAALLGRLSGQTDVVIGTPVANRGRMEIENLIGFFINTLAVRVDLSGEPTVEELLERVKKQAVEAQQNQDIPFEQVVEIARPVRSLSHSPLFQVLFAWQNAPVGKLKFAGVEVRPLRGAVQETAKFDLGLSLQEAGDRIVGGIEYATSLFERGTIERYLGYYRKLLEGMVRGNSAVVERLAILGEEERGKVLYEWNRTEREYESGKCVQELFEEQAGKTPEAVAVVAEEAVLSYGELNRRANQLAHYLRQKGVKPDTRVALCMERGLEMVVGLLGVLKAGGAYVPLDPAYPAERLRAMLADSDPVALLTVGGLDGWLGQAKEGLSVIRLEGSEWKDQPESNPEREGLEVEHLAYVIYTSGSTGTPKGAMNAHRGV